MKPNEIVTALRQCSANTAACRKCPVYNQSAGCLDLLHKEAAELIEGLMAERCWIPVTERLPDTIPCDAGTEYSEAINVLTDGRKVLTAIWNGTRFLCDADYWEAWDEKITHWTPVLFPLPELPDKKEVSTQ